MIASIGPKRPMIILKLRSELLMKFLPEMYQTINKVYWTKIDKSWEKLFLVFLRYQAIFCVDSFKRGRS